MSSSDSVTKAPPSQTHFLIGDPGQPSTAAADAAEQVRNGAQASPFTSLGERPEMELDLWEGQFNLSSPILEQFTTSLSTEELQQLGLMEGDSSTCWGEDSTVTMGTVQQLQDQVGLLTEAHFTDEERYDTIKQDNAALSSRIFLLEEQLREAEERNEDALKEEKKRNKELVEKLERERQIAHDNFSIKIQQMEVENGELREKTAELQSILNGATKERRVMEEQLAEMQMKVLKDSEEQKILREEMETKIKNWEEERESSNNIIHELSLEIGRLKGSKLENSETDSGCHLQDDLFSEMPSRIVEIESELRSFKKDTLMLKSLLEKGVNDFGLLDKNQELEGEILNKSLQKGKDLIYEQTNTKTLAAELEELSNKGSEVADAEISKLQNCLTEQEHVNLQLQTYIDTVLLNIMERNPELLEIPKK